MLIQRKAVLPGVLPSTRAGHATLYTHNDESRQLHRKLCRIIESKVNAETTVVGENSHLGGAFGGLFEIQGLPLSLDDPFANLLRGLTLLRLKIGIEGFLHASGAMCTMRGLKAATKAVVTDPITIAVAGHLVENPGYLLRDVVCNLLVLHCVRLSGPLSLRHDRS